MGNTAFTLKRNLSVNRANASTTVTAGALIVTDAWGNTQSNFFLNNSTDLWCYRRRWYDNTCTETGQYHGFKNRTDRHAGYR
ncbi:hypothetical protein O5466_04270 [Escherichia coli]|nr:hypothetical protein [Escherichia coli]